MVPQRNILIDDYGRAQICDFGLVRIFLDEGSSGMTTTTNHTGTERYLAYELVATGEFASPTTASDIYAVGCIGLEVGFNRYPCKEMLYLPPFPVHLFPTPSPQSRKQLGWRDFH
jgi:serine/threonine protein kinase